MKSKDLKQAVQMIAERKEGSLKIPMESEYASRETIIRLNKTVTYSQQVYIFIKNNCFHQNINNDDI